MTKTVVIIATLDTKGQVADFLREEIQRRGYGTVLLDIGMKGEPEVRADISREEVILASGQSPEEVTLITDRGKLMSVMIKGATKKVNELYSRGDVHGVICIGGVTGTQMGTSIMKPLPLGVSKFAVSSTAGLRGFASRYFGTSDLTLMHSVIEIAGLNNVMKNILVRAAGAICGMAEGSAQVPVSLAGKGEKPLIAITQGGWCEKCATSIRSQLEEKGYQVIGFPANGIGDKGMEEIIERNNIFGAVIDLAPGAVGEELFGFTRAAGSTRLEAAGKAGVAQIIAPSIVNFGSPLKREYKPEYYSRKKYDYDAARTFIRLSKDEMIMVANTMADKLNKAKGPVKVVIPLGGWSSIDARGTDLYEPELDRAFVDELKKELKESIEVKEVNTDLDTAEFAQEIVNALGEIIAT